MKFIKRFFRFFAVGGNEKRLRESPAPPTDPVNEKSGELTREQLAEILNWLSLY